MEIEEMSIMDLKTILEMIVIILEGSKDKEEALEKIKNLSILSSNK